LSEQLAAHSKGLGKVIGDLENEDSLLHALLYEPERASIVADLQETMEGLKLVVKGVNQGEGTVGLLAQDPTLYEDLRSLVGGAQRNKLLRNYIRRTIEKAEKEDATSWSEDSEGAPE